MVHDVQIFVVSAEKISGGGYETLFKYVIQKGGPVGGMLRKLPPSLQVTGPTLLFCVLHPSSLPRP